MTDAVSKPDRRPRDPRPSPAPDRLYAVGWLVVAVILCAPVWLVDIPPLSDYYNHLARLYILHHHGDVAAYQELYAVGWGPMPNLALDVVGLPLIAAFGLAVAAKMFLTLVLLLWHAGCHYLGRAVYGRPTRRALVCSFFVYNQQLLHGYANFLFSMGLGMLALAYFIEHRRQLGAARLVLLTVIGAMVFLAHLSGFASFAIAVAAITAVDVARGLRVRAPDSRRALDPAALVLGLVPLLPGTILFFYGFLAKTGEGNPMLFAPLPYNARDSLTLLTGYSSQLDMASVGVVVALIAVAVGAAIWTARGDRRLGLRAEPLAAGVALGVAYWVCPSDVASGIEVNVRFALGAFTLLAFAVDLRLSPRLRGLILGLALLLFSVRVAYTAKTWIELDDTFAAQRAAFAHIDEGAAVHNIYFYPAPPLFNAPRVRGLALIHALGFAAVDRHANVPTLYGLPGQQPLSHRIPLYRAHRFADGTTPAIAWDEIFARYAYLWTCRAPAALLAPLADRGQLLANVPSGGPDGRCALYRLVAP